MPWHDTVPKRTILLLDAVVIIKPLIEVGMCALEKSIMSMGTVEIKRHLSLAEADWDSGQSNHITCCPLPRSYRFEHTSLVLIDAVHSKIAAEPRKRAAGQYGLSKWTGLHT